MTEKLNTFESNTIENLTIRNDGTEPGAPGHVTIHISGGTHTHYYGAGSNEPTEVGQHEPKSLTPPNHTDSNQNQTIQTIATYPKRLSELKHQICTWDDSTQPGIEFWVELYGLCEDLEKDLDGVLE